MNQRVNVGTVVGLVTRDASEKEAALGKWPKGSKFQKVKFKNSLEFKKLKRKNKSQIRT